MSLSRLSLPSIRRVLETDHGFIPRNGMNPSPTPLDQPGASMTMTAALALGPTGSQIAPASNSLHSHLMKTIDSHDSTLEDEEEEEVSLAEFPDEPASEHGENQVQGSNRWIKHNLPLLVTAVRKLLPIKIAEALLRKAGHVQH